MKPIQRHSCRSVGSATLVQLATRRDRTPASVKTTAYSALAARQRGLAVCHDNLGDVRLAKGDLKGALTEFEARHTIAQRLAAADPGNAQWQRDLTVSHLKLFQFFQEAGQQEQAIQNLLQCHEILRGMKARGMQFDRQMASLLSN